MDLSRLRALDSWSPEDLELAADLIVSTVASHITLRECLTNGLPGPAGEPGVRFYGAASRSVSMALRIPRWRREVRNSQPPPIAR